MVMPALCETFFRSERRFQGVSLRRLYELALVVVGVLLLALCAKIQVPIPPSPVPINMGTFAVLTIGAGYGLRLGVLTLLVYMAIGASGLDVFANSSAENNGWAYMFGPTGGYLAGFVLAAAVLGLFAHMGWDRKVWRMGLAMLVGNVVIYLPGLLWLHTFANGWAQTLEWGLWPFLFGDFLKLLLAALLLPLLWTVRSRQR